MIKIIFSIWMLSLISCAGKARPLSCNWKTTTTGVYTGGGGGRVPAGAGGLQENAPTGMVSRFDFRASVDSRSQSSVESLHLLNITKDLYGFQAPLFFPD